MLGTCAMNIWHGLSQHRQSRDLSKPVSFWIQQRSTGGRGAAVSLFVSHIYLVEDIKRRFQAPSEHFWVLSGGIVGGFH